MADKKYVVLKWKDGWQEVVAVEGDVVDFNKYYVIERLEEFGRLVLNRTKGEMPELLVIDRDPKGIEKIALVGGDELSVLPKDTYREGTRLEYNYDLSKDGDFVGGLQAKLKEVLAARGTTAKELLSKGDAEILAVAKAALIVGTKSQQDVVHFVKAVLSEV